MQMTRKKCRQVIFVKAPPSKKYFKLTMQLSTHLGRDQIYFRYSFSSQSLFFEGARRVMFLSRCDPHCRPLLMD